MLLEAKTAALCPSNYGTRFAANGDTWMADGSARARRKAVVNAMVERDVAAKKLDDVVFPDVQPPPMATQLQNLGGVSAIVVGAFCHAAAAAFGGARV
jgi:acetyl-CoA acetyltransferase